jgi:hypothetical protein
MVSGGMVADIYVFGGAARLVLEDAFDDTAPR